ncbi:enoyl-CoA hydratase/isomerase family protein [Ornithinibacillus contaminans]|uniref:enoyl-CoA hydratase/isomerase family protein n=1 Tax=Ornithinibacillus contaminans TaxID=694055 RepID=UPI00064DF642|nr:enoyl-CoA hydratase/isomerase family protein [Ornithinibacillus contaminans]
MADFVTYQKHPTKGYGLITLNRSNKRNAISLQMAESFRLCLQQAKDDNLKCLVVTGAGERMFCAGGDLKELHGELTIHDAEVNLKKMMQVLYEIAVFPMPTIALLNGDALGGGCELATACDIRIAKEKTRFGFVQTNLGIIPGWGGGVLLTKKVHPSFSYQWIMEGNLYDAQELETKGWIHRVVREQEWESIDKLIEPYWSKSVKQLELLKEQYLEAIGVIGLHDFMMNEVERCASLWDSDAHKNAVAAFLSRH